MDLLKEAFQKVKEDIFFLHKENLALKQEIDEIKRTLTKQTDIQADKQLFQAQTIDIKAQPPQKAVKTSIFDVSTGNEGVQAGSQADRQAVRHIKNTPNDTISHLQQVSKILASLDEVKREIREKFKKLTNQEMNVFSTIYQLEEQGLIVDYALLAQKLSLSENAIRDYTARIIRKGIPLEKIKENNKKIVLSITSEMKKLANLATIQELRKL